MDALVIITIFIFGTIIGSFLNVVVARYGSGFSFVGGRSMCFSCSKTLRWFELVPLFSFLIQRAKCRGCKSAISWQYPLMEVVTAVLFVLAFMQVAGTATDLLLSVHRLSMVLEIAYLWIIMSLLIMISAYDIRHKIIPDAMVYSFAGISLLALIVYSFVAPDVSPSFFISTDGSSVWQWFLAGPLLFSPFAFLWFVSQGKWMGFGDAKLAWGIGWFLGIMGGASAIILGFWAGALVGICLLIFTHTKRLLGTSKMFTMKSEIPFGPFLVFGVLLVVLLGVDIFPVVEF